MIFNKNTPLTKERINHGVYQGADKKLLHRNCHRIILGAFRGPSVAAYSFNRRENHKWYAVTPEDFTPAVRIVAFTDSHNRNERVAEAVDTAYELFDNDSGYKGVDAFFGLGDFSSVGGEGDEEWQED